MKLVTGAKMFWNALIKKDEFSSYLLSEKIVNFIYPDYIFSEFGRSFLKEKEFREYYSQFDSSNWHSYDRKYFLDQLFKSILHVDGDTAECGVFQGATSWLMCNCMAGTNKRHHIFDSFEGLSQPEKEDGEYWLQGNLSTDINIVKNNLKGFDFVEYHKGWIPDRFEDVDNNQFCFVHIDVDLYDPTKDSIEFFYARLNKGGILLCDDYGFESCPGATKAMDDFFQDKPEQIVNVPTGQAFIIKR